MVQSIREEAVEESMSVVTDESPRGEKVSTGASNNNEDEEEIRHVGSMKGLTLASGSKVDLSYDFVADPNTIFDTTIEDIIKSILKRLEKIQMDDHDKGFALERKTILRYLRARRGNPDAALKSIVRTMRWRKSFGVHDLHARYREVLLKEHQTGKLYVSKYFDKRQRPIIILRPHLENTFSYEGNLVSLVYNIERALKRRLPNENQKLMVVIDFTDCSMKNTPPLKTTKAALEIMQEHYVESLGQAILVNAPWIFHAFFKMIKPFIDEETQKKLVFLKTKGKGHGELQDILAEYFRLDHFEESLGGNCPFVFQAEEYLIVQEAD